MTESRGPTASLSGQHVPPPCHPAPDHQPSLPVGAELQHQDTPGPFVPQATTNGNELDPAMLADIQTQEHFSSSKTTHIHAATASTVMMIDFRGN
uniref:Uncharacterized protein n=1 Tax=Anopheles minimus TaxID=112268 RepID=A0A182WMU6_9DIPT